MVKKLRAKLIKQGVPRGLLADFEAALVKETEEPLLKRLDFLARREIDSDDENFRWKTKYFQERDRANAAEMAKGLLVNEIEKLNADKAKQAAQICNLQSMIFGDKSERGASKPKAAQPAPAASSETIETKPGKRHGTKGHGRKRDEALPVQAVPLDIEPEDCICSCGGEYELTDLQPKESTVTSVIEQAVRFLIQRRTVLRKCKACGKKAEIVTAKKPAQIIPRSKYSNDFWQFILEEKFWLQRPLNRVCKRLRALGIIARAGTLINGLSILHKNRVFEVMYEAILEHNRAAAQRGMDDTGWKIFEDVEGKDSHRWYMWVSITSDTTIFAVDPRRSNEAIADILGGASSGIIVCDRHSALKCFAEKYGFTLAFCWIHQKRDFIKLRDSYPEHAEWAQTWIEKIGALIAQNKVRVAAMGEPELFRTHDYILRTMVSQMKAEIDAESRKRKLPKERLDEMRSLETHWVGLTVFVDHPIVPMDNNASERALREAVLARKSYYGSRSVWSGALTAQLMTIYATLEQNGINPKGWLKDYLALCSKNDGLPPPDRILKQFYPWNYKPGDPTQTAPPTESSSEQNELELSISLLPAAQNQAISVKPHPS